MQEYEVYYKVLVEFATKVFANSKEEAEKLAFKDYAEASLRDFDYLDQFSIEVEKV